MTNQEMFDIVWTKYVIEGQPSAYNGSDCDYRTPDGRRCAIGWCLSEEQARALSVSFFKGTPISYFLTPNLTVNDWWRKNIGLEMDRTFANDLQSAHDYAAVEEDESGSFLSNIKARLTSLAEKYNLTIPEA